MPKPITSGQEWFYSHIPSKAKRPQVEVPPASQIPGLNDLTDSSSAPNVADTYSKRKWIRDTDSKYVRLAKAGGRKDLFKYREHRSSKDGPVPYPRVDWFDHDDPPPSQESSRGQHKFTLPDWYVHDEYVCESGDFVPALQKRPVIAFDNLSVWKRDGQEEMCGSPNNNKQSKSVKFPSIDSHAKKGQFNSKKDCLSSEPVDKITNFPQIKSGKESPANIKQLLSMGYQNKWLEEQKSKQNQEDRKKVELRKQKERLKEEHKKSYAERSKKKKEVVSQKPLFKLSRFNNVGSKVGSLKAN